VSAPWSTTVCTLEYISSKWASGPKTLDTPTPGAAAVLVGWIAAVGELPGHRLTKALLLRCSVMVTDPSSNSSARNAPDDGRGSASRGSTLPRTPRGRRTRATIVDAAAAMIYQRGVAASTLDDILLSSGTGKSQLYYYFDDKADLVRAVIARQVELILQAQPLIHRTDSMRGIQAWADGIIAVHSAPGGPFNCPLGTMAAELKNDPSYQPPCLRGFRACSSEANSAPPMTRPGWLRRWSRPCRAACSWPASQTTSPCSAIPFRQPSKTSADGYSTPHGQHELPPRRLTGQRSTASRPGRDLAAQTHSSYTSRRVAVAGGD
jgi:TetR/AcrR family transcriptional regulator, transcriptional repressor for nem operon